jgi:salicylate hydroxylase
MRGSAARFSGRIAMRARVDAAAFDREILTSTGLWLGAGAHLVHYPIRGGREINLVAILEGGWTAERWDEPGDPGEINARFANWPAPARQLLAAAPSWRRFALATVDPATRWVNGRVALIGDAAHAMLPFAAQGGAMAIEDAAVLARHLSDAARPVAGRLATYEAERRPRVLRVARTAALNGRVYHLSGAAAFARDAALRLLGARGMARPLDWLYGWRDG